MTQQQTICSTHEWETPVREVAAGQVEIDGDDYCTTCGVERHDLPQYRFLQRL